VVKPLNGLQVRSILDRDEELEALLSRVAASRRLVIDVGRLLNHGPALHNPQA
jgi:hypothetical protein